MTREPDIRLSCCIWGRRVELRDGDDERPSGMAARHLADRRRSLGEWIRPADHRLQLPGVDELLQRDEVVVVLRLDRWLGLLAHEHRDQHRSQGAAQLAIRMPAAVRDQLPGRGQRASGPSHGVVADVVEDQVVACRALGEVCDGVVDDVVRTDGADQFDVLRARDAGHLGAEGLRDLDGEGSHAAGRAIDEDPLARANVSVVAEQLECGRRRYADGRRLLEGERGRLLEQLLRGCRRVLRERARAPAEDLVPRAEILDIPSDSFHDPRDVGSRNRALRTAQTGGETHDEWRAGHEDPVADMDRRRSDPDEHLVSADLWLREVTALEHVGRAVPVLDDGLHRWPHSWRHELLRTMYALTCTAY